MVSPKAGSVKDRPSDGVGDQTLERKETSSSLRSGMSIDGDHEDAIFDAAQDDTKSTSSGKGHPVEDKSQAAIRDRPRRWEPRTSSMPAGTRKAMKSSTQRNGVLLDEKVKAGSVGEGRMSGLNVLAKPTDTSPASSVRSTQEEQREREEEGARGSPTGLFQDSSGYSLRRAHNQQDRLQEELDRNLEHLRRVEEEHASMEREKDYHEAKTRASDRTIVALEAKITKESEERQFWSNKYEEIHGQYLKTESEFRIFQAQLADRNLMWKREWERKNEHLLEERDRCRDGIHAARRVADDLANENNELRRQVLELKHSISTSTRTEGQVTDDVFREKVRNLGHDVQNWTINNFRRKTIDLSNVSEETQAKLASLVPCYAELIDTSKLNVIQSLVSSMLVQDIFSAYFCGLRADRTSQFQRMEEYFATIGPPESVNQWRSLTLTIVRHSHDSTLQSTAVALVDALLDRINDLLSALTATAVEDTARSRGLRAILERAVDLARLFRVQRAQFTVEMLHTGTFLDSSDDDESRPKILFDSQTMDEISGEDVDDERRTIRCVTFPGVWKTGDEQGANSHLRNVIVKAKVLC